MSYGVAHIDDLETFPIEGQEGLTWRPVRRHFDIRAFGVNAYTAAKAGQRVIEEHREEDGHEELYVVVSGRAAFTLDGDEHDAPTGTLVHCPPGTLRGAVAAEAGTSVLGIGAKPGEVFRPSGWEWTFAGMSRLAQGDEEGAKAEFQLGNIAAALERLEQAAEIDREAVAKWAPEDRDLESLRHEPRFLALTRQSDSGSAGS